MAELDFQVGEALEPQALDHPGEGLVVVAVLRPLEEVLLAVHLEVGQPLAEEPEPAETGRMVSAAEVAVECMALVPAIGTGSERHFSEVASHLVQVSRYFQEPVHICSKAQP